MCYALLNCISFFFLLNFISMLFVSMYHEMLTKVTQNSNFHKSTPIKSKCNYTAQNCGRIRARSHRVRCKRPLRWQQTTPVLEVESPWFPSSRYFQGHVSLTLKLIISLQITRTSRVRISCCVSSALVEHCVLKPSRISAETSIIDWIVSIVWIASRALFISYSLSASITIITVLYTVH